MTENNSDVLSRSENPLGLEGVEFVEYATAQPEGLGKTLELMGFAYIARHRSRRVFLYRQGTMTIVVNADHEMLNGTDLQGDSVTLSGIAFRVADASSAYRHMVDLGAWPIPTRAGAMELNIPGVHGVGDSVIYLVDRHRDFSIFDVDFVFDTQVSSQPPALADMHFFGLVQYVGAGRMEEWIDFYDQLLGFTPLPQGESFGILTRGSLLKSPCNQFYLQLFGPPEDVSYDIEWDESLARLGIGTPDVHAAVEQLQARGVTFEEGGLIKVTDKGALTRMFPGKVHFELVASRIGAAS